MTQGVNRVPATLISQALKLWLLSP